MIATTAIDSHGLPEGYELYLETFIEAVEIDESEPVSSNSPTQTAEPTPTHLLIAKNTNDRLDAEDNTGDESIASVHDADISNSLESRFNLQASKIRLTTLETSKRTRLYDLIPEIQLKIFDLLCPVKSTCLGLTCKKFYSIHREYHGKVGLMERSPMMEPTRTVVD